MKYSVTLLPKCEFERPELSKLERVGAGEVLGFGNKARHFLKKYGPGLLIIRMHASYSRRVEKQTGVAEERQFGVNSAVHLASSSSFDG